MSEAALSRAIVKHLNALPECKAIKLHGGPHIEAGTPDILCVHRGRAFLLETKRGARLTKIQDVRLRQWADAGAQAAVVHSVEEAITIVQGRQQ